MADLTARSPAEGLLPQTIGQCALTEEWPEAITALSALSDGADLPAPGETATQGEATLLWSGRRQAMAFGPVDPPNGTVGCDQTDAWCVMRLDGPDAADVLARLTPLDLNPAILKPGHTARSLLGHMNALFHRIGPNTFRIMVFRSMAASAVHEIERAMKGVAARRDA
ncbi:sarcosine oxidase subunit gamma [uncultured Jannaschia sp.]|uniref:sarcosine oxidase subunit gamma n=1 Tax=uncultured Jannaschia sp. TaxID=293347 RepID=UPI0026156083|nr:sarcosine oxidase subunit gamma [uncultured Jannaschia sp.]